MSTGLECDFVETTDGKHYFLLERTSLSPEERDDLGGHHEPEDYDCYGPFATFDLAHASLQDNFANPGGFSLQKLERPPEGWLAQKIAGATVPPTRRW